MNTKEKFKDFVKNNPILLKYVKNGDMTWQKFYEIYDMYGEDNNVWSDYLKTSKQTTSIKTSSNNSFDVMSFIKGIDLDSLQEGVNSVQRVLGLLQDINPSQSKTNIINKPRPLYKHFED